jgi:hypothetical protein
MKKNIAAIWAFCCLAFALACIGAIAADSSPAGVDLFNGKDFTGWTFFMRSNSAPEKTWSVTNGVIHCLGRPTGFLRTEKDYSNYKLTVEWRFVRVAPKANNTGVLVQMQAEEKIWPKCIECQGMDQKQGDFWLHSGAAAAGFPGDGKKSTHVPMAGPPNEKPVGEWNLYQVIASGDTVEIIVNGQSMNKITGCNVTSGGIGIQSEGADIEVRKVFLEPLK